MLEFLAGKPIPVKDVFRLGKYASKGALSPHRPRPVLVKLTTPFDFGSPSAFRRGLKGHTLKLCAEEGEPGDEARVDLLLVLHVFGASRFALLVFGPFRLALLVFGPFRFWPFASRF